MNNITNIIIIEISEGRDSRDYKDDNLDKHDKFDIDKYENIEKNHQESIEEEISQNICGKNYNSDDNNENYLIPLKQKEENEININREYKEYLDYTLTESDSESTISDDEDSFFQTRVALVISFSLFGKNKK